jgi:hypothetical protein
VSTIEIVSTNGFMQASLQHTRVPYTTFDWRNSCTWRRLEREASVPRGRAHAIKRFREDRQTIFKKKIFFLKKISILKKRFQKKDFYRVISTIGQSDSFEVIEFFRGRAR